MRSYPLTVELEEFVLKKNIASRAIYLISNPSFIYSNFSSKAFNDGGLSCSIQRKRRR